MVKGVTMSEIIITSPEVLVEDRFDQLIDEIAAAEALFSEVELGELERDLTHQKQPGVQDQGYRHG